MRKKKVFIIGGVGLGAVVMLAVSAPKQDLLDVRAEPVARRDLVATVIGSGQLQPRRKVDVSSDAPGRVIELRVREGSLVRKGDVLLRIDPTRYEALVLRFEAQLAQSSAGAEQAQINLIQTQAAKRRAEEIEKGTGMMASADLEAARAQAAQAEAHLRGTMQTVAQGRGALEEARDNLAKATIVAPMNGRVTRLNVREGEFGGGSHPDAFLLTIADVSEMEAKIVVDETDLPHVSIGDSATLRIDAFPRSRFSGRVVQISSSALRGGSGGGGQQSNNFQVIVALDRSEIPLHSDFSATAEIVTEHRGATLSVPILALVVRDRSGRRIAAGGPGASGAPRPALEGVFVVEDDVARFRPVRVGIVGDQYAEILAGLKPGETVVSGTYQVLRELEAGTDVFVVSQARR